MLPVNVQYLTMMNLTVVKRSTPYLIYHCMSHNKDLTAALGDFLVRTELVRAKDGLQDMNRARELRESLCSDLTCVLNDLTVLTMPAELRQGLEEHPDEMLTDILVRHSNHFEKRYMRLNCVDKRFRRSIVSSTPSSSCCSYVDTYKWDMSEMCKLPEPSS